MMEIIPLSINSSNNGFNFNPPKGFAVRKLPENYEIGINVNGDPNDADAIFIRMHYDSPSSWSELTANDTWMPLYVKEVVFSVSDDRENTEQNTTQNSIEKNCQNDSDYLDEDVFEKDFNIYQKQTKHKKKNRRYSDSSRGRNTKKTHQYHHQNSRDSKYMIKDKCSTCLSIIDCENKCECIREWEMEFDYDDDDEDYEMFLYNNSYEGYYDYYDG